MSRKGKKKGRKESKKREYGGLCFPVFFPRRRVREKASKRKGGRGGQTAHTTGKKDIRSRGH